MSDETIYVCSRCNWTQSETERAGPRAGAALYEETRRRFAEWPHRERFTLMPIECMSNCKRPCIAALVAPGKYTFMFGDLPPGKESVEALLECALLYAGKSDGFMKRDERPELLRKGILARIPPLPIG